VHNFRRRGYLAILSIVATLALAACGGGGDDGGQGGQVQPAQGGVLNYGADQEPTGFNVNTSKDSGTAARNVTIAVLPQAFNASPKFEPVMNAALLESAELTKEDPQTVTYKIKPNAAWSDGTPISAKDFIYNWKQQNGRPDNGALDKEADVASTTGYEDIQSITGSDGDKTVTAVFSKKFTDWKSLFTDIIPAHIAEKAKGGWNNGFNNDLPVSGGPFMLQKWNKGKDLTIVRNDKYFGEKAKLDNIVFRFLPDSSAQPAALQNREVDMIYPQPQLDLVQQVKQNPDIISEINFGLSFEHLTLNFKNEFLKELPVRQALAKALNRDEIVRRTVAQFDPKATRLDNRIYLTGQPEYVANAGEYATQDTAGAQKLLEGAGFTKGADGIYEKGGKKLSLRISTTAGNALREAQEQLIQQQARTAGIDIQIKNAPSDVFFDEWLPNGNFDIANFAWVGTPYPISSTKANYVLPSEYNYGFYDNPRVKQLFEQANVELDKAKAAQLANEADKQIWADMATIPLYQKPTYIAFRNTFVNIHDNATSDGPFWNAQTWGVKNTAQ
jgi:peptide/nickel transport system substrate-binding protein